ncbi:MAG: 6-phosphogluconolactonase [bacterium]|nr:6-phosphogluconolactonase [bacterium]
MDEVLQTLREQGKSVYNNQGISVVNVLSESDGIALVLGILEEVLNKQTVLYLSGGRTPKELYREIAGRENIIPGAFAMVDERFGMPMHDGSNEKMLSGAGLLRFATVLEIPLYKILQKGHTREETADTYDQTVRNLLARYQSHIGILGIGIDGHTAGLPAAAGIGLKGSDLEAFQEDLRERSKSRMVIDYDDKGGFYGERITMTFLGLSMMDILFVIVFGEDKKHALELLFSDGTEPFRVKLQGEEEVPSRFFKRPDIAKKTLVITDQEVL